MKILFVFLCCLVTVFSASAQSTGIASTLSKDVYWYGIHIEVNPAVRYLTAHVQSKFIMTKTSNTIVWDFTNELQVDSIIYQNQKIQFIQSANNLLMAGLPQTLQAGSKGEMDIYYHGIPPVTKIADNDSGYAFITAKHKNQPVLFTVNEPFGAMQWWPTHNGLFDKADSIDIFITHPASYKASANGKLQNKIQNADKTTTHFKHRYPIASYLVAFAVSNYVVFERTAMIGNKKLSVITYAYPENVKVFEKNITALVSALGKFSSVLGEYPFMDECYTQTQVSGAGGMEHQSNSFVDVSDINLQNHELAHQWFGNKITHNSWSNIWLKEGAAVYCADYLYPLLKGKKKLVTTTISEWLQFTVSEKSGSIYAKDSTNIERLFDGRLSYVKPTFVYRMLQSTLGDSSFFKGLYNYLNDTSLAYRFAGPHHLQYHLEQASGIQLDYFFKQWIYGEGYPSISLDWEQQKNGKVKIKLSQQTSHASVDFFKIKLPIRLMGNGKTKNMIILVDKNNMTTVLANPGFSITKIIIDPEHWFITSNNKVTKKKIVH